MRTNKLFPKVLFGTVGFLMICVLLNTGTAIAATYYVATTGNDSYSNVRAQDPATPWRTLQHAADNVAAGDTVIVKAGTYTWTGRAGGTMCTISRSGLAGCPITFRSENPATTDPNHATLDCNWLACIGIYLGGNYITIDGFEIKKVRASSGGAGIFGTNKGCHDINIKRNLIHHIGSAPSLCSDNAYGRPGIFASSYKGTSSYNWLIDSNMLHDIGRAGGSGGVGVWNLDPAIGKGGDGKHDHPLYLELHDSVISNNLFYNTDTGPFRGWPVMCYDYRNSANNKNIKIINNTFIGPSVNVKLTHGHIYFGGSHVKSNNLVENNISWQPNNALVHDWGWGGAASCVIRNNITTASSMLYTDGNSNIWEQRSNTKEYPTSKPMFVNAKIRDYHLASGSPAIDSAYLPDLPHHDLDGRPRPQGLKGDIGAYEYPLASTALPGKSPNGRR